MSDVFLFHGHDEKVDFFRDPQWSYFVTNALRDDQTN
jgi:hypothetical protein